MSKLAGSTRVEAIALDCIVHAVNDSPHWVFTDVEFNQFVEQLIIECTSLATNYANTADHCEGWADYRDALTTHLRGRT